ncbi:hypothetical protein B7463_g8402, partial [Scytalidium lignicola]
MLGSQIKRAGQDALAAAAGSTPKKPLLFLYPQWIRNSSAYAPQQHNEASLFSYDQNETDISCGRKDSDLESERSRNLSRTLEVEGSIVNKLVAGTGEESKAPQQELIRRVLGNVNRLRYNALTDSRTRQEYFDQRRLERGAWVPDWRVILSDMMKHTPDAGKWLDKAVIVSIPEGPGAEQLMFGIDDNIWDIGKKYGCTITIGSGSDAEDGCRVFLLSGPTTAIGKTASDILSITENKAVVSLRNKEGLSPDIVLPRSEHSNVRPLIRTVMSGSEGRRTVLVTKAGMMPKPTKWTTANFAAYVHSLTKVIIPNHIHAFVYMKGEEGRIDVVNTLIEVFSDPQAQSAISRKAFNEAMIYLVKLNRIADARALFVRMDMAKLQMDPETFNIMLRGAAKAEDLHNFHYVLHLMLRWGFTPNPHTWISFLMAVKDVRIKAHIISAMKRKGLVNHTSVLKSVGEQLVSEEITFSLEKGQSLEEFLQRMDYQYGHSWLTTSGGNRILHVLGSHGLIFQCWKFLQEMEKRFVKIDTVSINTCLSHCTTFENLESAIEIIKRLWNFQPDDLTFSLLFKLATSSDRLNNFNVAKVVWKYACLSAGTTAKMRAFMTRGLKRATDRHSEESQGTLKDFARRYTGLMIIGVPSRQFPTKKVEVAPKVLPPPETIDEEFRGSVGSLPNSAIIATPTIDDEALFIRRILSSYQFSKGERMEWYDIVRTMLLRDCNAFKEWHPAKPFGDLLVEALAREQEWKRQWKNTLAPLGPDELRWRLDNAVSVPVKRNGGGHQQIYQWK